jgi:hypothetical protein
MKILYFITLYSTYETFLKSHVQALIDAGHKVDIACSINKNVESLSPNVTVYDVPFSRSIKEINFFLVLKTIKNLINSKEYDYIHLHTPIASAIVRILIPFKRKYKVYYTAHGFHFHPNAPVYYWLFFIIEWILSAKTDKLILINRWDYAVAKRYFFTKDIVLSDGVGLKSYESPLYSDIRNELGLSTDSFIMINVAEHNKNKNQLILLRIIRSLRNRNVHLILVGQGKLTNKYKRYVEKHKLEKQIHILGYRNDVFSLLNGSNLFVFPSKREGLGMALLEALVLQKRFIAFNIRGVRDICEGKYDDCLIRPYSYNFFKARVLKEHEIFLSNILFYKKDYSDLNLNRYSIQNAITFVKGLY